jgi:hypothetical protein
MRIDFNQNDAMNSDGGSLIDQSGNYKGKITKAEINQGNEQSMYITFGFESQTGDKTDYVRIYTRKKDGERCFGFNLVQALMGLLHLQSVEARQDGDKLTIPQLIGRSVGFGLQKEYYTKSDGNVAWKMNLIRFYDVATNKTYTETINGKGADKWELIIQDKGMPLTEAKTNQGDNEGDFDDLPF